MNCKGLVELIVLNLGYDAQVISQRTFAIMVIMALVTTFITVPLVSFIYPPLYHDKPEEPANSTHHKGKKNGPPSVLVCVNKIEQVPPILSVIHLLQSKLNTVVPKDSRKGSHQSQSSTSGGINPCLRPQKDVDITKPAKTTTGVVINSLRLIELTERDSSVMLQTSQDALKDDPVTKMLRTFCEMNKSKSHVRSLSKVVTMNSFGDTLVKTSEQVNAKYILIPWSGSGSMIEDMPIGPIQQAFGEHRQRRQSIHTPVQHANFIQDLLAGSTCTVLILVDRGLDVTSPSILSISNGQTQVQTYQQIYLPYFGGPDDREALEIVIGLSAVPGVKINVIRYKNIISRRYSGNSDMGSGESNDTIEQPEMLVLDAQDDDLIRLYFGGQGKNNMLYSEVESYTPVTTALQFLGQLSSSDLVIIGRGNTRMQNSLQFKNGDNERRKVLGDVAESFLLCPCNASVLVVQSNRLTTKL